MPVSVGGMTGYVVAGYLIDSGQAAAPAPDMVELAQEAAPVTVAPETAAAETMAVETAPAETLPAPAASPARSRPIRSPPPISICAPARASATPCSW